MRKLTYLLIIATLFDVYSCAKCKDSEKFFDITGMNLNVNLASGSLDTNLVINFENFFINMNFTKRLFSNINYNENLPNFFSSPAYALDCMENGQISSEEKIESIIVFSNNKFDSSGTAGDTLNKYFKIASNISSYADSSFQDLNSFLKVKPSAFANMKLRLKSKPSASLKHQFTITYKQTNGEVYTAKTPAIEFEK